MDNGQLPLLVLGYAAPLYLSILPRHSSSPFESCARTKNFFHSFDERDSWL
jgi:hypothetical protein